jgi:hypothetical protein
MNPIDKDMQTKWVGLKAGISDNDYTTDQTPQGKKRDNDFKDMRAQYVLRPRLSWTGLYGKAPWPRERKQWEKV